ncbi:hypothetical protein [Allomuricauda sp. SCSIO 65647]|uniref:hypothetical protein n=1 Tax=Allomuricauda sp. SCSIO 65647 TaxID=2908843 RepID=UPI001F39CF17|nr:hypothetical protein [Muricauda sp. SCSIO 65647]UJH66522.1 hypothetical protein L0P89_11165 [Muricauda sp. SCSIO 65647]
MFKVFYLKHDLLFFCYLCRVKLLKVLFDFYIDASIHVALAVLSLYLVTLRILGLPHNFFLAGFMVLSTIVCYNFIKYGVEAEKYLIVDNSYHKIIQAFSFVCFGAMVYFAFQLSLDVLMAISVLTIFSVLYALPVWPNGNSLRSLGVLKIFIVALVWTGFTVILPIIDAQVTYTWDVWILLVQRFLLILVLILPFEVRDVTFDYPEVSTIPRRLGLQSTKRLGYFLVILFFGLTFLKDDIQNVELMGRSFVTSALFLVIYLTKEKQSRYFSSFWVEGIPLFWFFAVVMLENL